MTPEPQPSSSQELSLTQIMNLIERQTTASQTASEKFKATCEKMGLLTDLSK
jgi:hypothetical protein